MFGILQSSSIPALEQALVFSQKRHDVLASNIANSSTPGYKSRDLDVKSFQNALAESIRGIREPDTGTAVAATTRDDFVAGPRSASEQIVYHDGSDVSMENQVTQIAKNNHLHSLAITT